MMNEARVQEPLDQKSDESLMTGIMQSDRAAYATLVARHTHRFLALAERLLYERSLAEDVIQDVFLKLWLDADKFNPAAGKFTTWFYRVVSNRCFDEKRRKKPGALPENFEIVDSAPQADEVIDAHDRGAQIVGALDKLPARQQLAITLCYFEEMSNKQAAEVMDIHVKALESLLTRARTSLRNNATISDLSNR